MSTSFPNCFVYYLLPDVIASANLIKAFGNGTVTFQEKSVDLNRLYTSLQNFFNRYIDEMASGRIPEAENFKYSLLHEIDLPELSILAPLKGSGKVIPQGAVEFPDGLKLIFQALNSDAKFVNAFVDKDAGGSFKFIKQGHDYQAPFDMVVKGTGPAENVKLYSLTRAQPDGYKIHITPKPEYALYTLLRLLTIMKQTEIFHGKNITAKIILNFRQTNPKDGNTELIKGNGGAAPTIVFYANHENKTTATILDTLLSQFQSQVSLLGAMTPDYKYRILPFNVRLNSLISYAQGDRMAKLNARKVFVIGFSSRGYFMPKWVQELINESNAATNKKDKQTLSTLSLQLLGKDVSSPELQAELRKPTCEDDICWMTNLPSTMLDPRTLTNLKLEEASAGSEEADTSANNALDENPTNPSNSGPIGAGAGAGTSSGGRRQKFRNTKKTRKTKRKGVSRRGRRN